MIRLTIATASLAVAAVGCGDNSSRCGEGTYEDNGVCLPDDSGNATCGQGTVLNQDGECVPSDEVCAEGTVFLEGECVPEDDTLTADLEEAAEPNDGFEKTDDVAGQIALDAVGDGTSFHGCITPYRDLNTDLNPDVDYDMWLVTVEEPSLIDVTADGVHGLSAGFFWLPASATTQPLIDADWFRYGINLANDTSSRQVYLPIPGTYALVMSDSRSLFLSEGGAGHDEETCYFTSIEKVAIPTATAIAADTEVTGTIGGDTLFYSYNPTEGDLVQVTHLIESDAGWGSVLALRNAGFRAYAESGTDDETGETLPAEAVFGGMVDADTILIVVEPTYNYAQVPVGYNLMVHPYATTALPTDGTTASGTATIDAEDATTFETLDDITWMWFDVGEGEVVHFDMSYATEGGKGPIPMFLDMALFDADLDYVSLNLVLDFLHLQGDNPQDAFSGWVRFPEAGRYYAAFFPPDHEVEFQQVVVDQEFDVTSTVTRVVPGATTHGTPVDNAAFSPLGRAWRTYSAGAEVWSGIDASATSWGAEVSLDVYDAAATGVIDVDFGPDSFYDIASDGSDADLYGRVMFGSPDVLIGIQDLDGVATETSTYDLTIDDRTFTNLGSIAAGTPISRPTETSVPGLFVDGPAPGGVLYFIRGVPGELLTFTVTPTAVDMVIELIDRGENLYRFSDAGGVGEPETMRKIFPDQGWLAFRVWDWDDDADHAFALDVSVADACAGGDVVEQVEDDFSGGPIGDEGITAVQTLPFTFDLFGANVTDFWISSNGFLAFGPETGSAHFTNQAIPTATGPQGVVAGYWDDLQDVVICRTDTADAVKISWVDGVRFNSATTVNFSVELQNDNDIVFTYGDDHFATGSSGTVGAENLTGTSGNQQVHNTAGQIQPGEVITINTGS